MRLPAERALMIQPDNTILLDTHHDHFQHLQKQLAQFSELIKTLPQLHTYRITPLSLWNAASMGMNAETVLSFLCTYSMFGVQGVPVTVKQMITDSFKKFDLLWIEQDGNHLQLCSKDANILDQLEQFPSVKNLLGQRLHPYAWQVGAGQRGLLKQAFIHLGYPIQDLVGYEEGEALPIRLRQTTKSGQPFIIRDYQKEAIRQFSKEGTVQAGSGVIVLPCGAGKTIVGIGVMAQLSSAVLIVTSNRTSLQQWKREIIDKTMLSADFIGEYDSKKKEVKPITITTYQMLTYRKDKDAPFAHMDLFRQRNWGLIIYDEVHLLPAPVFRATADIQAKRRLGLTATLVREDGLQKDVFSLVGPKKYEMPWKELEQQGWIASVNCYEINVPLDKRSEQKYQNSPSRQRFRIACENRLKEDVIEVLVKKHAALPTLIIGQYLLQLRRLSEQLKWPLITGSTADSERERLFSSFRGGHISGLVVSKVANFAIDLPDAALLIQVSGSFGSRQEEAQRLGRVLRAKDGANEAYFYSVVSQSTTEQDYALNRQLFLVEQGYQYQRLNFTDIKEIEVGL